MTARQLYENVLVEINKVSTATLLLDDFNYLANKAIYQYINKRYNVYDYNQQTSDDLRVLKSTAVLKPTKLALDNQGGYQFEYLNEGSYQIEMPLDYYHILNCICSFKILQPHVCYNVGTVSQYSATRLTSDIYGKIINNYYMRPSMFRPYYSFVNLNANVTVPTDPFDKITLTGRDMNGQYVVSNEEGTEDMDNPNLARTINGDNLIEKGIAVRYSNASPVMIEIKCGNTKGKFELDSVFVDYLKSPQNILLTRAQLEGTDDPDAIGVDTSQVLEFPDYVCYEIVNNLTALVLENFSDPRIQTNIPINQTIPSQIQ